MNTTLKRSVAGILASLMLFASANLSFGANFADVTTEQIGTVDKVVAAGIMIGTDLGFEPSKELTRAESAAIMVRLKGISESTVEASKGKTNYTDVAQGHWAEGYINVATTLGLIKGVGANQFAPDRKVTYAETLTMLVRSLGAGTLVEAEGTWPSNYMTFAVEEKLTDGVYKADSAVTNRIETAKLVTNTINKALWVRSGGSTSGNVEYSKDATKTLLNTALNLETIENKLLSNLKVIEGTATINGVNYKLSKDLDIRVEDGMMVDAWINEKDEVVMLAVADKADQQLVEFESIKSTNLTDDGTANDKITLNINGSSKEYSLLDAADISINGVTGKTMANLIAALGTTAEKDNTSGKILLSNNKIAKIFLTQYTDVMVVEKVEDETIFNNNDITSMSDIDLEDAEYLIIDEKGNNLKLSDIEEGDTLLIGSEGSDYRIMVVSNTAEGSVTEKSSKGEYIKLGTKKYNVNKLINPSLPELKDSVKVYLDNNDQIVAFELVEESVDSSYGIITEAAGIVNSRGEISAEVEITLLDGTKLPMKELDITEMEKDKKFDANLFDETSTTEINKQLYTGNAEDVLLGQMVRFKNGSKIEIVEFVDSFVGKAVPGQFFTDKESQFVNGNGDIKVENKRITLGGSTYRVDNNTVVIVEKNTSTDAYKTGIEVIDWNSLNDNNGIDMTLAKINEDTNHVKYVYLRGTVSRNTSDNYGMIVDVAETQNDKEYRLTILSNEGEIEVLVDNGTSYTDANIGQLVTFSQNNGKIVGIKAEATTTTNLTKAKIGKFNNGSIKLAKDGGSQIVLDSMDKLVFISANSISVSAGNVTADGLKIGKQSDIRVMGSTQTFATATTATEVYYSTVNTDGKGEKVAVVLYVRK